MKFIYKILVLSVLLNFNYLAAQESIPITKIENKLKENPKYIIIELYTDWCGICAIQHKKIQKDEDLISKLNEEFYFIRFDAESNESFIFNGHEFKNQNKIHDFAKAISSDSNAFPAWIIMNPKLEIIFQYNGLIEPEDLKAILLKLKELN